MIDEEIIIKLMEEYVPKSSRYVSCIRIDGKPILPPLINDEYRKELLHYRKLALLVEKKLKDRKSVCDNRQSIDSGVIANAISEPSWLNNMVYPLENITTSFSGINKCTVNCESNVVSKTVISENASSNTLICDDDMWRYLSNCSSDNCNTSQIDISEFDLSPDISQKFEKHCDVSDPLSKSVSKLTGDFALEKHNEPIEQSIDVCGVRDCDNVLPEYNTGIVFQNDSNEVNECENAFLNDPCQGDILSLPSEKDNLEEIHTFNSENTLCGKYTSNKIICDDVGNSVSIDESVPSICDGSSKVELRQSSKLNVDLISVVNGEECVMSEKAVSGLTTLEIEGHNLKRNSSKNSLEDLNHSCKLANLTPVDSATNCLKTSLVFPICLADGDKKIEEYDPSKYSSEGTHKEGSPVHSHVLIAGNRSSGEIEGLECDNTFNDSCGINIPSNLDYSCSSQKIIQELPLSENISVSEIDYQTCSVASISQDTPEETSEVGTESSANKNDYSDGPKLVRQNSYTLIAPSPILLAHAKASEKVEDGGISEDDNAGHQKLKVGRKSWGIGKSKIDCDSGKTGKCVYAVPLKQTHDFNRAVVTPPDEVRSVKNKLFSLPVSTVASPVKINPYSCSVDNLPMVNVRKFHDFITSKANFHQLSSESHASRETEVSDHKLDNYPSIVDVAENKSVDTGKADLTNCNLDNSQILENKQKNLSKPKEGSVIPNQVNIDYCINLEETFKSTSFSESATSHYLSNSETSDVVNPVDNYKHKQPASNDSLRINHQDCNYRPKSEEGHPPIRNDHQPTYHPTNCLTACDSTVQSVFLQLQNEHSLLMAQLLDRQKKEQETLANTFLTQQRQILQEMKLIPGYSLDFQHSNSNSCDESSRVNSPKNSPKNFSEISTVEFVSSHSQSYRREPQNVDVMPRCENEVKEQFHDRTEASKYSIGNYEKRDLINSSTLHQKRNSNYNEECKKAATIINAYVRGYLVRRLLKTEHVQEIIKTISESVMCALQLQRECPFDITPSDVELHRRLIQQLTAACHSLHETFFSLTLQERMNIIATDREKRSSQLTRPVSARSAITSATQKYIQRKQQLSSSRQSERPATSTRRSWWRSKGRASSAGNYDQPSSCFSKQPNGISSKQQQCNNRSARRPWR